MEKRKNVRNLKVYEQSGHNYKRTPTIMLKGLWLKELGFDSNMSISVKCENGRLIIESREPQEERIITTVIKNGVSMVDEDGGGLQMSVGIKCKKADIPPLFSKKLLTNRLKNAALRAS